MYTTASSRITTSTWDSLIEIIYTIVNLWKGLSGSSKLMETRMFLSIYELLGNLKEIVCPYHAEEGAFIVPKFWKRCPVCYDQENSKFSKYYV